MSNNVNSCLISLKCREGSVCKMFNILLSGEELVSMDDNTYSEIFEECQTEECPYQRYGSKAKMATGLGSALTRNGHVLGNRQ